MSDEWKKRLNDQEYKNWLKVTLALIESKEALHNFTENIINNVHDDIKTKIGSAGCTAACSTKKGKPPTCSNCTNWVSEIISYRAGQLVWKNADPKIWHNKPWEIAKCYMNAQGSPSTAAQNTGADKTDLSGILNVVINCKEFRKHLKEKKLAENVRTVRNDVMHCPTMSFSDADMKKMVDQVIALLEDEKELKHLSICKEKVKAIKSIRDDELELKQKDEKVCIGTALENHALAAASGEEIDEGTAAFYNKLIKLIKDDSNLKKEFEGKITNINEKLASMKQEYDNEFSSMKIIIGELTGRIESLEKNAGGQSLPNNPTSSILGHGIKSFYKNALQSYAQKKKLDLPEYACNECEKGMFLCTVNFNGKEFTTKEPKPSKKEAEQSAAEEALIFLGNEDEVVSNENTESSSTDNDHNNKVTEGKLSKNYKNMLQEKTQKEKIHKPIYNTTKTDSGFFTSQVMYNESWYEPDMSPQRRKVDAEQKAAQFAFLAILDREEKEDALSDSSTPQLEDDNNKNYGNPTNNAVKSFKVILNEHVQKMTKGEKPDCKTENNSEGNFICSLTVFGKIYTSPLGVKSLSEAKETAAKEACKALELIPAEPGNSLRTMDLCSPKEKLEAIKREPSSEEVLGNTPRNISTELTSATAASTSSSAASVDKPDGKSWVSLVNEYAQKMRAKLPVYKDIPGENPGFRMKVIVLDETFECEGSHQSKKVAKEMAAKMAMMHFNNLTTADSTSSVTSQHDSNKMDQENPSESKRESAAGESSLNSTSANLTGSSVTEIPPQSAPTVAKSGNEITLSGSSGKEQIHISKIKTKQNFKSALQEYAQKRKLHPGVQYVNIQDSTTKEHLSKVSLGRRCFKGKQPEAKIKEAEKHVAEIALKILEGRGDKPDPRCIELLKEYHKNHGFPSYPKYEESACDGGKFTAKVTVKKKYEFQCTDKKTKKKDVEIWLAEQAVKLLEEEDKMTRSEGNAKSRLNVFLPVTGNLQPKYDVQGIQAAYTGCLSFYADDVYESLCSQNSKEEAISSAAMSACNGMDL